MNYSMLPPEINSLRMFSGAGSTPMVAAAVAWDGLAAELGSAASSFGSNNNSGFQNAGPSNTALQNTASSSSVSGFGNQGNTSAGIGISGTLSSGFFSSGENTSGGFNQTDDQSGFGN